MKAGMGQAREPDQGPSQHGPDGWDPTRQGSSRPDSMRPGSMRPGSIDQDLLSALSGKDAQGSRRVADRTRRAVRMNVLAKREEQAGRRRTLGIAMAVCLGILMLLAPALWSSVDDFVAGEHFGDIPTQVALLLMMLFPAVIAALIAGWRTQGMDDGRRSL